METMNIYAKYPDKVVAHFMKNGYAIDVERAAKFLEFGKEYTVDYTDVGGWCTSVYLIEFPGIAFNSVTFANAIGYDE